MSREVCVILGGGGHARVLIDCILVNQSAMSYVVLDRNPALHGGDLFGVPVVGDEGHLEQLLRDGATHFVVGLGAAGNNEPRRLLFHLGLSQKLQPLTIVHPQSICSSRASVGLGTQILPGSIVNACAVLGQNVIVNSGAIVEHDCLVGDHAHIATGAKLAGGVCVDRGAHVGAGAVVRQGIKIGENAVIGAGAVVVKDVAANVVVAGVPAKLLRPVKS